VLSAINLKFHNLQFAFDIQTIYENATFAGNGKNLPGFTQDVWAPFLAVLTHNLTLESTVTCKAHLYRATD
jgi:hypothetical protein